jgi:hypothetical protein
LPVAGCRLPVAGCRKDHTVTGNWQPVTGNEPRYFFAPAALSFFGFFVSFFRALFPLAI